MTYDTLQTILSIGETVSVEFKRGGNGAEADTFETICDSHPDEYKIVIGPYDEQEGTP